jgi:hypothetical protein
MCSMKVGASGVGCELYRTRKEMNDDGTCILDLQPELVIGSECNCSWAL